MTDKASKLLLCSFQSVKTPPDTAVFPRPSPVSSSKTITTWPGCSYGSGLSKTPLITLKMAVLAPMPSASVSTATAVKPGFFSSWRKANLRSFITQRLHRIDLRRAAGRNVAGKGSDAKQAQRDQPKRQRVRRMYAIEQGGQKTSQSKRAGQAYACTDERQHQ